MPHDIGSKIGNSIEQQIDDVVSTIKDFDFVTGIISTLFVVCTSAIYGTILQLEFIVEIPSIVIIGLLGWVGWSVYLLQKGVFFGNKTIPRVLPFTLYTVNALSSIPISIYTVNKMLEADESMGAVIVSMFFFPFILLGITYLFLNWLSYLKDLSLVCKKLPDQLNNIKNLHSQCLEALDIYKRLGPEQITGYRTSYTIDRASVFKEEYLEIVKSGVTHSTIYLVAPMISATLRLNRKQ